MTSLPALILTAAIAVTDGDTLRHGEDRYRLHGIDAPELDEDGGPAARDALAALLADNRAVLCAHQGWSWGRRVVRCFFIGGPDTGKDVGCVMIDLGYAREWVEFSKGAYARCERWKG